MVNSCYFVTCEIEGSLLQEYRTFDGDVVDDTAISQHMTLVEFYKRMGAEKIVIKKVA